VGRSVAAAFAVAVTAAPLAAPESAAAAVGGDDACLRVMIADLKQIVWLWTPACWLSTAREERRGGLESVDCASLCGREGNGMFFGSFLHDEVLAEICPMLRLGMGG